RISGGSRAFCDTRATCGGMWRALHRDEEIRMRAASIIAPPVGPWMGAARPRGTINAIVPPVHVKSAEPVEFAGEEIEGRTIPFERIDVGNLDPIGGDSEVDAAVPAPLPEVPSARSISAAVLSLTRIGKYELTGKLGRGSFGVVYTARDTELDRE